jgi:hypothetical protein
MCPAPELPVALTASWAKLQFGVRGVVDGTEPLDVVVDPLETVVTVVEVPVVVVGDDEDFEELQASSVTARTARMRHLIRRLVMSASRSSSPIRRVRSSRPVQTRETAPRFHPQATRRLAPRDDQL